MPLAARRSAAQRAGPHHGLWPDRRRHREAPCAGPLVARTARSRGNADYATDRRGRPDARGHHAGSPPACRRSAPCGNAVLQCGRSGASRRQCFRLASAQITCGLGHCTARQSVARQPAPLRTHPRGRGIGLADHRARRVRLRSAMAHSRLRRLQRGARCSPALSRIRPHPAHRCRDDGQCGPAQSAEMSEVRRGYPRAASRASGHAAGGHAARAGRCAGKFGVAGGGAVRLPERGAVA